MPAAHHSGVLSLEQVRGFVVVAEELHFGRAAERLRMTQPPLSRQIQKLERTIGVQLFERGNRSVRLTPAGEAFLAEARRLLAFADRAPDSARRIASGFAGRLAIGFTATVALRVLGPLLREVDETLPGVDVVLSEQVSVGQLSGLQDSRLDLGLIRLPPPADLYASRLVHRERLLAAVPAGGRFGDDDGPVRVEEFDGQDMIMYSRTDAKYFNDLVTTVLANVSPRSTQRVTQVHSMASLVAAGRGAAIVPESANAFHIEGVVLRPIEGWDREVVELRAVWRRDAENPVLMRALDEIHALQPLTT
jgi:DNA-binding transcriptional LysR family regulator